MNLKRYEELKTKVEEAQRNQNQCEGAKAQLMLQLKNEFECQTVEEAETLTTKLTGKIAQLDKKMEPLVKEVEEILEQNSE